MTKNVLWGLCYVVVVVFFATISVEAQAIKIRDLPSNPSPSLLDYLPEANSSGTPTTYKVTPSALLALRTITCTAPLLCAGSTSMNLGADRTMSIAPFYLPLAGGTMTGDIAMGTNKITMAAPYTPASGGAPFRLLAAGSTLTGGSNQGLRTSLMGLYDTRTSANDGVALNVEVLQTSHSSTIVRTGIQCSAYTEPDNGGDTSCGLFVSSGGGPGVTIYKHYGLRPTGLVDQSLSPQPALEVGSGDAGPAAIFSAGVSTWGTSKTNGTVEQRLGSSTSYGNLVWPVDGVYNSRIAYAVGAPQSNAQPVNMTYKVLASGDEYHFSGSNTIAILSAAVKLTNDTNDGSAQSITFRKSRLGLSVATNEDIGDVNFNFVNSAPAEIQGSIIRAIATDKTAGTEDVDTVFYQVAAGTLAERFRIASTGAITATGALAASNFSGSHTGTSSGTNTGDQIVPANTTATTSQWFSAYNSATGVFTKLQPAFSDLSGSATCAQQPNLTGDVTSSSCATALSSSFKGWTDSGTTVSTTTSTDKVGIGTSSPTSLLTVTNNTSTLPTPLAGTQLHVAAVDSTGTVMAMDTFSAVNTFACRRANGTASSPSAIGLDDIICNIGAYGYGTSAYGSTPGAAIRSRADQAWTNTAQGTRLDFLTDDLNTVTPTTKFSVSAMGHLSHTQTTAPTVACTGTGTSPAAPTIDSGGTDHKFTVTINTGTGSPGSTGTCTVTFATAFPAVRPIVCMLVKGATAWGNGATIQETTESASAPVFTWTNLVGGVATGLTVSTSYKFSCFGGF